LHRVSAHSLTLCFQSVTYGSGSFSGTEFTDTVSLGNGLNITKQSIGVSSNATGFDGVDGILGIGPVDLTSGTLSPATTSTIPTVTDNLFSQGVISANSIGISFEPTTSAEIVNGEITWGEYRPSIIRGSSYSALLIGGTDSSKLTGAITYM
jgi:cathepsin E